MRELEVDRAARGNRVQHRLCERRGLEVALAARVRVERLRVVVAVGRALDRAVAEATARERGPDRALVAAAALGGARDDRVTSDHEARAAALQLEAVDDVLQRAQVAALVPRAVQVRVEPVLVDQVPGHVPQHRLPAVAEAVRQRERGAVQPAVGLDRVIRERLGLHVARVRPGADARGVAAGLEERIRARAALALGVVQARVEQQGHAQVVAPALARLLVARQAVLGLRAAGETVRDAMAVLVDDDVARDVTVADPGVRRVLAQVAGRRRAGGDQGLDRVAVGLVDGHGRDHDRLVGLRAGQDRRGVAGGVVGDHDPVGA
jgi:hypothetical protein